MKKKVLLLSFGLSMAALSASPAFADTIVTFDWSFSSPSSPATGNQFSGSGTFTVDTTTDTITGITGSITEGPSAGGDTVAISSLLAADSFHGNDNLVNLPGGTFDNDGVAFTLADGSTVRLYGDNKGSDHHEQIEVNNDSSSQNTDFTITEVAPAAVPEPGSLALLGTGALGLAGVLRRRIIG